jgi:anti-anti-sigma factor
MLLPRFPKEDFMSDLPISYSSEERQGWFLWQVKGYLDRTTADEATEKGLRLLPGHAKFALDFSELAYLSSAGIRAVLKIAEAAQKQDICFALIVGEGMVREVLEISRIDLFVKIHASVEELVQA